MTILTKDTLNNLFNLVDTHKTAKGFTATIEMSTQNNFWGTHVKLRIIENNGKGLLITLFRDGHVTIKPLATFSRCGDTIPMLVLQEQPLGSSRLESDGSNIPIESVSDCGEFELIDLIVEQYPALKNLTKFKVA